jgi:hypothetical protein
MMWVMATNHLPTDPDALLSLIQRVTENYQPPPPPPRRRGKRRDFSALSFLLLAVVGVVLRTFRDRELHALLTRDDGLRQALQFVRVPHRTTTGRRLVGLIPEAEEQVRLLGEVIEAEVVPEAVQSSVSVIDGRMYQAQGPKWHASDRRAGRVPRGLRNVDCESSWSKSGYRGRVQGYQLIVQGLVFPTPAPLWAAWRPNHESEVRIVQQALVQEQLHVTDVLLGDRTYGGTPFTEAYAEAGGWALTPAQLPPKRRSWKNDLYDYRKETGELLFQRIIQAADLKQCPAKGQGRNGAFVLASVWVYQVCFLTEYREGKPATHVKEHLDCARWRIKTRSQIYAPA